MLPQPTDAFEWVQAAPGPALVCRPLSAIAPHLFTTRGWTLGSPATGDSHAAWDQVAAAMHVDRDHLARLHQVHGHHVVVQHAGAAAPAERPDADIIVSNDPSLALAIQTADCVPLLMADRRTGAVAAAHAGWRGLAAGVPGTAVSALARAFGSRPEDLTTAVGPSISAPLYEVGADVRARFEEAGFSPAEIARWFSDAERPAHWHFDGWQAARDQLESAGVPADQIYVARLCTASHPDVFCSYRRDGSPAGRLAAAIRCASPRLSPRLPGDPRAR